MRKTQFYARISHRERIQNECEETPLFQAKWHCPADRLALSLVHRPRTFLTDPPDDDDLLLFFQKQNLA